VGVCHNRVFWEQFHHTTPTKTLLIEVPEVWAPVEEIHIKFLESPMKSKNLATREDKIDQINHYNPAIVLKHSFKDLVGQEYTSF
jgi:NADH dehydrogenase FAD-containing subunit